MTGVDYDKRAGVYNDLRNPALTTSPVRAANMCAIQPASAIVAGPIINL
jgi:hypothetical protein